MSHYQSFTPARVGVWIDTSHKPCDANLVESVIERSGIPVERLEVPRTRSGVYFLVDGDEVVYIGQALSVVVRIHTHIAENRKAFTDVLFHECDPKAIDALELELIAKFRPKYNGTGNPDRPKYKPPVHSPTVRSRIRLSLVRVLRESGARTTEEIALSMPDEIRSGVPQEHLIRMVRSELIASKEVRHTDEGWRTHDGVGAGVSGVRLR